MTLPEHEQKKLDEFFAATRLTLHCYKHSTFSYLAVKDADSFRLCQARLSLQWTPTANQPPQFQSSHVRAGIYRLNDLSLSPKTLIETLLSGVLQTPHGELHFPPERERYHSLYFEPFHSGLEAFGFQDIERRHVRLSLRGERQTIDDRKLDWELKAATPPFDSISELCAAYSIGVLNTHSTDVEVLATNVAAMSPSSHVNGTKARLEMLLADGLECQQASLGYRMMERSNKVVERDVISREKISWTASNGVQHGEVTINVPAGAVLHCFAGYAGEVQHQAWIADPATSQNPTRAVLHAFDNELEALRGLIYESYGKGNSKEAYEFEASISYLFWMLGFTVTHLGGTSSRGVLSLAPLALPRLPA